MPDFLGVFYFYKTEALQAPDGRDVSVECYGAGDLILTSGKIVACDGLIPSDEPFMETVKPGIYPVVLSVAQVGGGRPVVACAMLRLSEIMPTAWKPATVANPSKVAEDEGESVGYGVDSGRGCFADLDAMYALMTSRDIYDRLEKRVHQPGLEWEISFLLDDGSPSNIIVFSSEEGDGIYPTYFGYDADGNVLCLATDFGIIAPLPGRETETPNKYQLRLDF